MGGGGIGKIIDPVGAVTGKKASGLLGKVADPLGFFSAGKTGSAGLTQEQLTEQARLKKQQELSEQRREQARISLSRQRFAGSSLDTPASGLSETLG